MDQEAIIERIKRMRINKNLTLKGLSKKTGFTEGYLSRIEHATNAPPIATLSRIAQGLNTDISYLLVGESKTEGKDPHILIEKAGIKEGRASKGPHQVTPRGYEYEALATKKLGKNMIPYILALSSFEPEASLQHDGEEFVYVLEGKVEVYYGSEKHILTEGDCCYFDSHIPHTAKSIGGKKARLLIVMYPYKRL